ncbi:MAG TPA: right-handed parallel beta-helix repeat-containing protein [Phycisphaerae bacterium]|nr:right-handed parallel beta-helix repeat-containing protein [Phycisphaerae bacterium]
MPIRRGLLAIAAALTVLIGAAAWAQPLNPPQQPWFPKAPPLPKPTGQVIRVTTVEELFLAADEVQPGGTILVADGHYMMPRYFELHTDNVTLRSESGRRERVVLDGARSRHGELVGITGCSGVTVADLSIQNVKWNGFKINSDRFATRVTVYNCIIHNVWQRGIKGPAVRADDRARFRPSDCRVQYCLFYNDRPKTFSDDPADTPGNFGGNYVGGMDIMYPRRWTISDNVFIGIQGRTRAARGAVFLWHDAEDCVVERNIIIDCDSGICLGNSHRKPETEIHCTRCVVRNNFVTRCPEQGILADYTRDCRIVHNTIHDPNPRLKRLIRLVHDNEGLVVAGNLLSGPPMRIETTSRIEIRGNVTADLAQAFVGARLGNLHLKHRVPGVVDAAQPSADVTRDIDRHERDARPDVGAHEFDTGIQPE